MLGSFNLKAGDKIKIQDAKEGCFIWADYVYLTKDTKTLTDVIAKAEALNLDNFEDGNAKNAFTEALANAKSVLANENSTQAVTAAKAIDLKKYQDGDVKEAFTNALAEAESALAAKELQEKVDAALKVLTAAQKMLAYVKLEPQEIDVAELQTAVNEAASAIAAAEAVDLTGYQDGNVKNAFRAALTNAQSALADVKINTNPVVKQYKISCYLRGGKNAAGNPTVCRTQKIVLKKPVSKIKKASATSRKVSIKKVTGAKGYQISYSTSASFKKSATKTVYAKKRLK